PVSVLIGRDGKVELALDTSRPPTELAQATLHALGHVLLGHVRPGDEYVHRDKSENVVACRPWRRWDREVAEAFPFWFEMDRKIESVEDCTPAEKAQLGLW